MIFCLKVDSRWWVGRCGVHIAAAAAQQQQECFLRQLHELVMPGMFECTVQYRHSCRLGGFAELVSCKSGTEGGPHRLRETDRQRRRMCPLPLKHPVVEVFFFVVGNELCL